MDSIRSSKIRPPKPFDIMAHLKSIKQECTELATNERWCMDKLNNIKRFHGTILDMMKDHVSTPNGIMVNHPNGETEQDAIMRILILLIEQKRSMEIKTQTLEEAMKVFKEHFEKLITVTGNEIQ